MILPQEQDRVALKRSEDQVHATDMSVCDLGVSSFTCKRRGALACASWAQCFAPTGKAPQLTALLPIQVICLSCLLNISAGTTETPRVA